MKIGIDGNMWYVSNGLCLGDIRSKFVFEPTLRAAIAEFHTQFGEIVQCPRHLQDWLGRTAEEYKVARSPGQHHHYEAVRLSTTNTTALKTATSLTNAQKHEHVPRPPSVGQYLARKIFEVGPKDTHRIAFKRKGGAADEELGGMAEAPLAKYIDKMFATFTEVRADVGEIEFREIGLRAARDLADHGRRTRAVSETSVEEDAVEKLAKKLRIRLRKKAAEGYRGWNDKTICGREKLSALLRRAVERRDPVNVAAYAMMLHYRGEKVSNSAMTMTMLADMLANDVNNPGRDYVSPEV